jgi:hypothetical protein
MTAPQRWPDNAEYARIDSIAKVHMIRNAIVNVTQHSNEIYVVKVLQDVLVKTFEIEILLNSVGPKADKQKSMGY